MYKLFLSYVLSVLAKENGYTGSCFGGYYFIDGKPDLCIYQDENECSDPKEIVVQAPMFEQIVDWFSEVHEIDINVTRLKRNEPIFVFSVNYGDYKKIQSGKFDTFNKYEALAKATEEAFKILKLKNK